MAQQKIPEVVLKLQELAKPTFVNRRWRKPALSARKLAEAKKSLLATGVYWPPKPFADRSTDKPLKLIKHERERQQRYGNRFCVDPFHMSSVDPHVWYIICIYILTIDVSDRKQSRRICGRCLR